MDSSLDCSNELKIINIANNPSLYTESLYSLVERVYQSTDTFCDSFQEKYPSINDFKNEIESSAKHSLHLCVFSENKIIGYLFLTPQSPSKLRHTAFFTMGIDPEHRGRGIGKRLVQAMLDQRHPENEIIYLMVRADNTPAIKLYEKFNFSQISRLKNDTKIGSQYFDGLLMSRSFIN